jgi:hypothetical protein
MLRCIGKDEQTLGYQKAGRWPEASAPDRFVPAPLGGLDRNTWLWLALPWTSNGVRTLLCKSASVFEKDVCSEIRHITLASFLHMCIIKALKFECD